MLLFKERDMIRASHLVIGWRAMWRDGKCSLIYLLPHKKPPHNWRGEVSVGRHLMCSWLVAVVRERAWWQRDFRGILTHSLIHSIYTYEVPSVG